MGDTMNRPNSREEIVEQWTDEKFREIRDADLAPMEIEGRAIIKAMMIALVVAALLSSGKIVEITQRQPLGGVRDASVSLAEGLDRVAHFLSLNRPADLVARIRSQGDAAGQEVDVIDSEALGIEEPEPVDTTVPSPATSLGVEVTETTIATTTTQPPTPSLRTVTAADPLRVYVAGDSQAEYLGYGLINLSEPEGQAMEVTLDFRISTGLARPDYFNWPAELAAVIEADDPEAVMLFMGANDHQDMNTDDGAVGRGSAEWQIEYARRVAITMDLLEADHRLVFWVAQPPMRDASLNEGIVLVNSIAEAAAAERPWVVWVDAFGQFGGLAGFDTYLPDVNGSDVKVRAGDGVHLTTEGAEWLAADILDITGDAWTFVP